MNLDGQNCALTSGRQRAEQCAAKDGRRKKTYVDLGLLHKLQPCKGLGIQAYWTTNTKATNNNKFSLSLVCDVRRGPLTGGHYLCLTLQKRNITQCPMETRGFLAINQWLLLMLLVLVLVVVQML